ncbi:MAG: LacI family DNA-binding transcriptional regulator [Chromatiales bacterium]|jgi:LacI family transcriptional regulator|nr:LacI family DNA-binding transcriptional regulator [Chromatiales bacterium]
MHKATIDDVAELAGVSIKTVSRVVNQEPNVRDSTRARVEKAIAKLNYRPNRSARNLASQRSHLIALIYDDPSAYEIPSAGYVIRMQLGVLRACRSADYELLIHPCNYRAKRIGGELQALIEHARPIGIILAAPLSNMPRIVSVIEATGTPFVRLSPGKRGGNQYIVATNDREISAQMTRYLASLGHKRIAFIKGHPSHKAVANRYLGYLDGLNQSGLSFSERLVGDGENSFESGEVTGNRLLRLKRRPTAIFAANDDMAAGVIRAADLLGVKIPDEVSVAGCDDIALARQLCPTLTTIRQPLATMAERAALLLIDVAQKTIPGQLPEVVPATLQIRESTGPAPE